MPLRFCLLLISFISLIILGGCEVDPEKVRNEVKDPCITAVRDFVELDLKPLALKDSCVRDLATGYCNPLTCIAWLSKASPNECSDPALGYGFLKKEEGAASGVCPNYLSTKLRDSVLKTMCATAQKIVKESGIT